MSKPNLTRTNFYVQNKQVDTDFPQGFLHWDSILKSLFIQDSCLFRVRLGQVYTEKDFNFLLNNLSMYTVQFF